MSDILIANFLVKIKCKYMYQGSRDIYRKKIKKRKLILIRIKTIVIRTIYPPPFFFENGIFFIHHFSMYFTIHFISLVYNNLVCMFIF